MMEFGTGISSNRDLEKATIEATNDAIDRYLTSEPELLVVLNAGYGVNKQLHRKVVTHLQHKFPSTQIAGSSMPGIFTDESYAIRGVGVFAQCGVDSDVIHMNRIRAGVKRKMKKLGKKIMRLSPSQSRNSDNRMTFLFAPGYSFPEFIVKLLQKETDGLNPFFLLNSSLIRKFSKPVKFFGKAVSRMMDNLGLGFSYSSLYDGLEEFKKLQIRSAGSFAMDALSLGQARSWYSNKITSTGLIAINMSSDKLRFGLSKSNGISINKNSNLRIEGNIPGGFLTQINNRWGKETHLNAINCPSTVFYRHAKSRFFLDPFNIICVEGETDEIGTYVLVDNPNIKSLLSGIPHAIINDKKYEDKIYFGIQSAREILSNTHLGLMKAKEDADIEKIEFGFFFDCVNRALAVNDSFKDLHKIYQDFMDGAPFIGSMSGGEIISDVKTEFPVLNASIVSCIAGT